MPELPEVETIIRRLRAGEPTDENSEAFPTPIGRTIRSAWGNWPNSIRPSIKTVTKDLPGHCIQSINRRGKYIVFQLFAAKPHAVRYLIIHLKMSGRLEVRKKGEPRHKHVATVAFLRLGAPHAPTGIAASEGQQQGSG